MRILVLILCLGFFSFGADRDKARATSTLLDTYVVSSQSTTPDAGLAYRSDRDDVDNHEVFTTTLDTSQFATNQLVSFARDPKDAVLGDVATTACTGDFGNVTVSLGQITISTIVLPVRIRCTSQDGKHRVFWTTYKQ